MNPSRIFIVRPIATSLIMAAIFLAGLFAFKQLPLSALPQVDYPTMQVLTLYPGASPEVLATTVTAPLERQFGQMAGLRRMTSASSGGASVITLQFDLKQTLDVAEQEVQAAINAATTFLPTDLPTPPVYSKVNPADAPVMTVALTSTTLPLAQVEDAAETRLAPKISEVPGVGLVTVGGGRRPAVRIQVNPTALASYNLTLEDLRTAVSAQNVDAAKGSFDGPHQASTIGANDQLSSSDQYKPLIIAFRNGSPVRVSDVADVVDDVENSQLSAWKDDTPSVVLNIQRQPGSNVIAVVDRIKQVLPQLQTMLPPGVKAEILSDRTVTIRASVHDVEVELILACFLVVAVIFVFLRTSAGTLIPGLAVPLSLVGTFGIMYLLGFSLNNLTLMALAISAGFVVDDAIVMIENISRFIEEGYSPIDAALKGSKQIAFTIISLTISLIAVLIPLLFMGDVVGRLFREFSITLGVTILISAIVSLTLTPMMCALLLRRRPEQEQNPVYKSSQRVFDNIIAGYGNSLRWVLDRQGPMLLVAVGTLAVTVLLFFVIPKGFFPVQDTGMVAGFTEASQSVSFPAMASLQRTLARAVLSDSAVQSLSSFIGVDGTNQTLNAGRLLINLKPEGKRKVDATEVIRRLVSETRGIPGIRLFMLPVQDLTIESSVSKSLYQYSLEDPDAGELGLWTQRLVEDLSTRPELADVSSDQQLHGLQARLSIDRPTAARLGLTAMDVDNALYDAYGQRMISTIFTQLSQYRVILEVKPEFGKNPDLLRDLYLRSATNGRVPLGAISRVTDTTSVLTVGRQGQFPASLVSFNLAPGVSLGKAIKIVLAEAKKIGLPPSIYATFQGTAEALQSSLTNEFFLILAALITVYIVLGVLYESYVHPVTILSTLPSAGVGALGALLLFRMEFSIIALIGIILLIGIVKKNGIMMVDFALQAEREEGKPPREAIYQASLLRFRPIMMTTLAALFAAVPLAFGGGVGSELRRPLGISIIGGLIFSQALTLYTTPVIYLWFARLQHSLTKKPASGRSG
ncbi:MAG TPA: efflux RND transporter permease subunit [Chitinivibrionales bacterium]|nr:efflux RND transporter permease subunit [Chitinivibrionales bacterium]